MCTVDMDFHKLKINKAEKDYSKLSRIEKKRERLRNRNKRDNLKRRVSIGDFNVASFFETDRDIKLMREPFAPVNNNLKYIHLQSSSIRTFMISGRKVLLSTWMVIGKKQKSISRTLWYEQHLFYFD